MEIVREDQEIEVVGELEDDMDIGSTADRLRANVVLTGQSDPGLQANWIGVLYAHPRLRLVVLSRDGRSATVYQLRPHRARIVDVSPRELLESLRFRPPTGPSKG